MTWYRGSIMGDLIGTGIALLKDALDRFIPDKTAAAQAKAALDQLRAQQDAQEFLAAADIVKTEAQSSNWLTAGWRPVTMLTFVALICARVFGLTSAHVSDAEYMELWQLVKFGLGGYVLGRSVEKTAGPLLGAVVTAIKGNSQ
jgi:Holin of 3TMs, for gene-transfer release